MKNLKKTVASGLALAMLAGCSSNSTTGSTGGSSSSGSLDTVTIATATDVISWDNDVATDGTSFIAQTMFLGGLMELDENGLPVEDLAESYEVSDDQLTYTFHLRDGLVWSNGDPVTADDFVYSWKRILDPDIASDYNWIMETANIVNGGAYDTESGLSIDDLGVVAEDDKTLVVTLAQPTGFFLSLTAFPCFFPLNEEFVEGLGDQYGTSAENLLSCGPYVLDSWNAGESYTFSLNEDYWNYDAMVEEGTAPTVTFKVIQDSQSALMSYEAGDMQVVTLSGEQVTANESTEGYTSRLEGYNYYISVNIGYSDGPATNVNVRKALSYALDRETIASSLNDGSVAAEGIVPFKLASNPDGSGNDFRDDNGAVVSYDVEEAKKYYETACEELGVDTIELEFLYGTDEGDSVIKAAEQIQSFLEEVGFSVTLNAKPKKERLELMNDHDYEIALTRWGPDYGDPQTYMDLWYSGRGDNNGGYQSDDYDALVAEAESGTVTEEERWQDFLDAEKILVEEDAAVIPVYQSGGALLISPQISGIRFAAAAVDNYRHIIIAE